MPTKLELVSMYAPILHFHPHESGQCCFPGDAEVAYKQITENSFKGHKTPKALDQNSPCYYQFTDLTSDNSVEQIGQCRIFYRIKYWFWYNFNAYPTDWIDLGDHEGDWEHVEIVLCDIGGQRVHCYILSQHGKPLVLWPHEEHSLSQSHIHVWIANGSHAVYPSPDSKPYEFAGFPDEIADGGPVWETWRNLKDVGETNFGIDGYQGRWGKTHIHIKIPFVGEFTQQSPKGPTADGKITENVVKAVPMAPERCVFDYQYYIRAHSDLAANGINSNKKALSHWNTDGVTEGRQAHQAFHTVKYLELYKDVKDACDGNYRGALTHYRQYGHHEGRIGVYALDGRVFNWQWYVAHHADLQAAGIDSESAARSHWLEYGVSEGRQAHPAFHSLQYLQLYADLAAAFGSDRWQAIEHYLLHGIAEGRIGVYALDGRVFNWQWYVAHHADLQAAGIDGESAARSHWLEYGVSEGRQAHPAFHSLQYLQLYADLAAAFGSDRWQAIEHYLLHGIAEGRIGVP